MNAWLTYAQAAMACGRSKRTIRRWVHDPRNNIGVRYSDNQGLTISYTDLRRVEAEKTKYRMTPTFGRANVGHEDPI